MQNPRGRLSMTDTAVNRESGWVGFVDIIMRRQLLGSPQIFNLWGERRHKSPADLAERYQPFATLLSNAQRLLTFANRLLKPEKFQSLFR